MDIRSASDRFGTPIDAFSLRSRYQACPGHERTFDTKAEIVDNRIDATVFAEEVSLAEAIL
jgi:hypothetical protein